MRCLEEKGPGDEVREGDFEQDWIKLSTNTTVIL